MASFGVEVSNVFDVIGEDSNPPPHPKKPKDESKKETKKKENKQKAPHRPTPKPMPEAPTAPPKDNSQRRGGRQDRGRGKGMSAAGTGGGGRGRRFDNNDSGSNYQNDSYQNQVPYYNQNQYSNQGGGFNQGAFNQGAFYQGAYNQPSGFPQGGGGYNDSGTKGNVVREKRQFDRRSATGRGREMRKGGFGGAGAAGVWQEDIEAEKNFEDAQQLKQQEQADFFAFQAEQALVQQQQQQQPPPEKTAEETEEEKKRA